MIKTYGAKEEEQTVSPQPPPSPPPTIIGESEIILNVPRFLPNNAEGNWNNPLPNANIFQNFRRDVQRLHT